MSGVAKFLKNVSDMRGDARLYEVSPPLAGYGKEDTFQFVVVSAAEVFGAVETYIFGSDAEGNITKWGELPGSFKGELDHVKALGYAGYEVVS